jgi:hypothetical protein
MYSASPAHAESFSLGETGLARTRSAQVAGSLHSMLARVLFDPFYLQKQLDWIFFMSTAHSYAPLSATNTFSAEFSKLPSSTCLRSRCVSMPVSHLLSKPPPVMRTAGVS